jgi:uncharacterized protein YrrD
MIPASDLSVFKVQAEDGQAGAIKDVLFDDRRWKVRHFVVETGGLLSKHKVMVDPTETLSLDAENKMLPVQLTKDEVKRHPDIESDPPRSHEFNKKRGPDAMRSSGGGSVIGTVPDSTLMNAAGSAPAYSMSDVDTDPHLRSTGDVIDYGLSAGGESIGKITDFLVDEESWDVPYAVVRVDNHDVLLPTSKVRSVGWPDKMVMTMVSPDLLRAAPAYEGDGDYDLAQMESYYHEM